MAGKIFINYRREDSPGTAGRLHDRLAQTFGRNNLFMDVDHIPAGVDFTEYLHNQVATCDVFLAVIGPNWLDAKDDSGRRRFDNPDDFVTIEIAAALARNIRVIPVLVDGARTPRADKLPDSIRPLVRRNAVEVRNTHFGRDAEALADKVGEALKGAQPATGRWPFLAWLMVPGRRGTVAGTAMALLLVGWIGLYQIGAPVSVPWALDPPDKAKAVADAGAQRKAMEAELQRMKDEVERQAKAAADAEAKRQAAEAEQQRLAAVKAEEERKARVAAEAEAKAKAEQAEKERLAAAKASPTPGAQAALLPPAMSTSCSNPKALGISRVVEIDTTGGPGFGFEQFKSHDFLREGEVVLTFDDGPWPKNTPAVLAALAAHCTKAIFFPIGLHATYEPGILKQVAAAGHAIGSHTWCHQDLSKTTGRCYVNGKIQSVEYDPKEEIEKGISAVRWAVGQPTAPFFRFPALRMPQHLIDYLGKRNIAIFSTDMDSLDFKMRQPEQVRQSVMEKLKKHGKGIVLMHDFQNATAEAAMDLFNDLKAGDYKVVFMKPKFPVTTIASYDELILKLIKG